MFWYVVLLCVLWGIFITKIKRNIEPRSYETTSEIFASVIIHAVICPLSMAREIIKNDILGR